MRGIKMPKINHSHGSIIKKKMHLKLINNLSPKVNNGAVNKLNNIDGWQM